MLSFERREKHNNVLVFGYIRLNYKKYICIAIKNLCVEYSNKIINFKIKIKEFNKCKNDFEKVILKNTEINILGNKLMFYIQRDYFEQKEYDLWCYIDNNQKETYITQIDVYYEIYCNDLKLNNNGCIKIDIKKIKQKKNYDSYIISFSKKLLKNLVKNKIMNLSLKFYLDLLYIKYTDNKLQINNLNKYKLNNCFKFEWNINYDLYEKFKNWNNGETNFFSQNFGFNNDPFSSFSFCLRINPSKSELSLHCITIPNNIKQINCRVELLHETYIRISNHTMFNKEWWEEIYINYLVKNKNKPIEFNVNIIINEIFDLNDNCIDISEWNNYNIIKNEKNTNNLNCINKKINSVIIDNIKENYFSNNIIRNQEMNTNKNKNYEIYNVWDNIKMRYFNSKISHIQ